MCVDGGGGGRCTVVIDIFSAWDNVNSPAGDVADPAPGWVKYVTVDGCIDMGCGFSL